MRGHACPPSKEPQLDFRLIFASDDFADAPCFFRAPETNQSPTLDAQTAAALGNRTIQNPTPGTMAVYLRRRLNTPVGDADVFQQMSHHLGVDRFRNEMVGAKRKGPPRVLGIKRT